MTRAPAAPDEVRGTLRLRDGTSLPAGATLRIVVKWYDEIVARHAVEPTGSWPLPFAFPVQWPEGKGSPTYKVKVYASAELAGRVVGISEVHPYVYPLYPDGGKPVDLVLHPAIE